MNRHVAILCFAIFSALGIGCQASQVPETAWWYDITFTPDQVQIKGTPIAKVNKNWNGARALSVADLKQKLGAKDLHQFSESKFRFEQSLDLNHNQTNEVFVVGVYKNNDRSKGRFLAVFENGQLAKIFEASGEAGFSALLLHKGQLRWYRCMQCGDFETVIWTGRNYVLE